MGVVILLSASSGGLLHDWFYSLCSTFPVHKLTVLFLFLNIVTAFRRSVRHIYVAITILPASMKGIVQLLYLRLMAYIFRRVHQQDSHRSSSYPIIVPDSQNSKAVTDKVRRKTTMQAVNLIYCQPKLLALPFPNGTAVC
jgi:hypothetical protein